MKPRTSLVFQWLRLHPSNTRGIGLISVQATNTGNLWCGQKKKKKIKKSGPPFLGQGPTKTGHNL